MDIQTSDTIIDSGTLTANQGTAAAAAGSWPVEVTDGTNILGTPTHPLRIDPTGTTTQPISGTVTTSPVVSSTSTLTQVVASANTNIPLIAANVNRKKVILYFPSGGTTTFIKFGATASATSWTYTIPTNNTVIVETMWQGEIDYFGKAQTINVTELT